MKTFHWLEQFCVDRDRDNYRSDRLQRRILFYGTYSEAKDAVTKKNAVFAAEENQHLAIKLKEAQADFKFQTEAQAAYHNADAATRKHIRFDQWQYNKAKDLVDSLTKKLEIPDWNPTRDGQNYWAIEEFEHYAIEGFEWAYDDDEESIVGFKETTE